MQKNTGDKISESTALGDLPKFRNFGRLERKFGRFGKKQVKNNISEYKDSCKGDDYDDDGAAAVNDDRHVAKRGSSAGCLVFSVGRLIEAHYQGISY